MENSAQTDILLEAMTKAMIDAVSNLKKGDLYDAILPQIKEDIEREIGVLPKRHEVHIKDKEPVVISGVLHEKFDKVLKYVTKNKPVYLSGPAGSGKNVLAQQVAQALGLEFYFSNAVTQEYKLTGFTDANGNYQPTQFYKAFTDGGVFLLDEMDASVPEVLVILNAAIANRYFDFPAPIGKVYANENFRVLAAGNTLGKGADSDYTGRFSLDAASLNRFAVVNVDYSPAIELAMAQNNEDLVEFAHLFRAATKTTGVSCLCSYRQISFIADLEDDVDLFELIQDGVLKGMDEDDYNSLVSELRTDTTNKYVYTFVHQKPPMGSKKSFSKMF